MKFDGIDQHISEDVFVTNGKFVDIAFRETLLSYEDGEGTDKWYWWTTRFGLLNKKDVTHWMPFPELPKE